MKERYNQTTTIPETLIVMKIILKDADFALTYSYISYALQINVYSANYNACKYEYKLEIFTILLNMKQKYNHKYKMTFCNIGHSY